MTTLLITLSLLCIFAYIKEKNLINPQFVFNFIWLITLSLYELKLSYIQKDFLERTIFIFWVCVLSYNIALILFDFIRFPATRQKKLAKNYKKRRKIAKNIVLIVFLLELIYSKGVPLIWIATGVRKTYFDYGIPSLHGAWCGLLVCLGAYSLFKKTKDKWLYLGLCIIIISRQLIMSIIIEGFIYALYTRNIKSKVEHTYKPKKIKTKFIVISLIIVVSLFTIIGNFRSGSRVMDRVFQARQNVVLSSASKWIYSYMTFSLSNFNNLVKKTPGGVNNGASMLKELLPTIFLRIFRIKPNYSPYYLISRNYNVSTYLPPIYLDFGIFGIAIFNFFMGIMGYILYKNIKHKKTVRGVMLYSVYIHNIILMFFINFFLYLPIIIQMFYIPLIFSNKVKSGIKIK